MINVYLSVIDMDESTVVMIDLISSINEYLKISGYQIKSDLAGKLLIGGIANDILKGNSMPFNSTESSQ